MNKVKILSVENVTHNVLRIKTEKPQVFSFLPGQAVEVSLDKPDWKNKKRPFTFTSLPSVDHLEFSIKIYPDHEGVTNQIGGLNPDDSLFIGDVFGAIQYKGEGIFIAGGAGITPFISIMKDLEKQNKLGNNKLIFANSTFDDIIDRNYFNTLFGDKFINVLSNQEKAGYAHGYITKEIIKTQIESPSTYFYLCGPPPMMRSVLKQLKELEIDNSKIVKESF